MIHFICSLKASNVLITHRQCIQRLQIEVINMRHASSTKNNHRHCIERLKIELIISVESATYLPKMLLNATSKNIEGASLCS